MSFSNQLNLCSMSVVSDQFLEIQCLKNGAFVLAKNCQVFFREKLSKTSIALSQLAIDPNHFRLFLILADSIECGINDPSKVPAADLLLLRRPSIYTRLCPSGYNIDFQFIMKK